MPDDLPALSRGAKPPLAGRRTLIYAGCGLVLGAALTVGGYLVDHYALYDSLPTSISLGLLRGLHEVTPVHYFADVFALVLALAGGVAGWLHDRLAYYSVRLEELVNIRTEQLRHLALHDPLTDLPNRSLLSDRIGRVLARGRRRGIGVAVLHVGINRFKRINESLGREVGDRVLVETALRLVALVGEFEQAAAGGKGNRWTTGSVFRIEGDEFAIVLEDVGSLRDATRLARAVLRAHEGPLNIEGREVLLHLGIGITVGPGQYREATDILRDAQTAMHRAKARGAPGFEAFDRLMQETSEASLHLETELYQAVESGQLKLLYQPVVDLGKRRIVAFEALARWDHPEHGLISPARFIPLAEETGLIVPLSRWLFSDALRRLAGWQRDFPQHPDVSMNMNLSPTYLFHPDMVGDLTALLAKTGADPARVHLEITESAFIDRPDVVAEKLGKLKERGFRFALDDFGTGYSSLSMLHELPFDALKIDREFVSKMCEESRVRKIVQTIIELARGLDLAVVAEGIESDQQLRKLRTMRCGYGQGYLLGRPLDVEAVERLLEEQPGLKRRRRAVG